MYIEIAFLKNIQKQIDFIIGTVTVILDHFLFTHFVSYEITELLCFLLLSVRV